jgi:hypothetical protein
MDTKVKRNSLVEFFYDAHEADKFITTHLYGAIHDLQKDIEFSDDDISKLEANLSISILDRSDLG